MVIERTDTALKRQGMSILIQELGYVDAERFVALMNREPFDYSRWRQENLENDTVKNISAKATEYVRKKYE